MDWPEVAGSIQSIAQSILGEPSTYTPAGGSPESITGIFEGVSVEMDLENGMAIQSQDPALTVRLASLTVPPSVGDAITVRSISYTIAEIHPDGQGDVRLKLEEV